MLRSHSNNSYILFSLLYSNYCTLKILYHPKFTLWLLQDPKSDDNFAKNQHRIIFSISLGWVDPKVTSSTGTSCISTSETPRNNIQNLKPT